MMWLYLLLGAMIAGPLWLLLARRWMRRTIDRTRRIASSARQQEHLVELGTLTGGLAHEIRNPLSTIKVNLQLLGEELDTPTATEQHKRWLRRLRAVETEVSRMQETLEDFLRFAGKYELDPVDIDFRTILSDLVDFYAPQAQAAGVQIRTSVNDAPLPVRVDADLIKQAMLNLMINAQQAMGSGGDLIIRAHRTAEKVHVEVIDTGPGMEPEVAKSIFKAYFTTKRGGTGLGLPTAHRIIRAHDGQITVDTAPGKGTRFVIELPARVE